MRFARKGVLPFFTGGFPAHERKNQTNAYQIYKSLVPCAFAGADKAVREDGGL